MTRDADFRSHLEQPLDLMKMGAKGWISVPSSEPWVDLTVVTNELRFRGLLQHVAINMTPMETEGTEPGMWEILVSIIDDDDPGPLPSDQVDLEVVP